MKILIITQILLRLWNDGYGKTPGTTYDYSVIGSKNLLAQSSTTEDITSDQHYLPVLSQMKYLHHTENVVSTWYINIGI